MTENTDPRIEYRVIKEDRLGDGFGKFTFELMINGQVILRQISHDALESEYRVNYWREKFPTMTEAE
jgi:hypothetical protein